jgi:hypothetical protein
MAITRCTVTGNLATMDDSAVAQAKIFCTIFDPPQDVTGENSLVVSHQLSVDTDNAGQFTVDLIRNTLVRFNIANAGYNKILIIPDEATKDFEDLVEYDGTNAP